jgi:serine/threonine-protein kinase
MTPRKIGTYELLELLGEGGIGQVYAARDTLLGRQVAIKTLRPELSRDRNLIARFYNEAQSLGDLAHPNITTLHALHLEGLDPFMVMELVLGRTLEAVLERVHHLPLSDSLAVIAQATAALAYAHRRGVIHRDIKPANLMVTDTGLLKVMDFGIARVQGAQRLTRAGQMFGTLVYASPEQIRGNDVDERSDLYSLAVMFYEMLAGTPPFTAENDHALMIAHLEAMPPPLTARVDSLDPRIEPAITRALAKRPEERFASVEEFARAVGATAVRGDATEILQASLDSGFRETPPQTRFIGARAKEGLSGQSEALDLLVVEGRLESRPARLLLAIRSPIAALIAVVLALAFGLGYVVLWPNRPIPTAPHLAMAALIKLTPQTALLPTSGPVPSSGARPEPSEPLSQIARQPPAPTSVSAEASHPAPSLPRSAAPAEQTTSSSVIVQPSNQPQWAPTSLPWAPTAKEMPVSPPSQPWADLQGTVAAIESASRIRVGEQWIDLYGINDATQRAHTQDMLVYLKPSRGMVECYQKAAGKYQCYADGKDLAVMALRGGLARATSDAPDEYRKLSAPSATVRH